MSLAKEALYRIGRLSDSITDAIKSEPPTNVPESISPPVRKIFGRAIIESGKYFFPPAKALPEEINLMTILVAKLLTVRGIDKTHFKPEEKARYKQEVIRYCEFFARKCSGEIEEESDEPQAHLEEFRGLANEAVSSKPKKRITWYTNR